MVYFLPNRKTYFTELIKDLSLGCKRVHVKFRELAPICKSFVQDLQDRPKMVLNAFNVVASEIFHELKLANLRGILEHPIDERDQEYAKEMMEKIYTLRVVVEAVEPLLLLCNIRANKIGKLKKLDLIGKMVGFKGNVVRVGLPRPIVKTLEFSCDKCKAKQVLKFEEGKYSQPTKCIGFECRSRSFSAERQSENTVTYDSQRIRVQEILDDEDEYDAGRVPRVMDVEIETELVDVNPGDIAHVSGIIKVSPTEEVKFNKNDSTMFTLYVEGISIVSSKVLE
ncbi:nucleic acid-binding protein, partial [Rozella allomycis CSF55]